MYCLVTTLIKLYWYNSILIIDVSIIVEPINWKDETTNSEPHMIILITRSNQYFLIFL